MNIDAIEKKFFGKATDPRFSILIPSLNNKAFLQLCIESIQKNSAFQHQIIVHVNDGQDGTLDLLNELQIDHTHSKKYWNLLCAERGGKLDNNGIPRLYER